MSVSDDLSLAERSIAELFDKAPCGLLSILPDGTIVQVNQTLASITGYPRDGLLQGRRFAELLTIPGQIYHDTHFAPLLQMQPEGQVIFDTKEGRLRQATLRIEKELKGHQGEGSSYHFQSTYTEEYVGDK